MIKNGLLLKLLELLNDESLESSDKDDIAIIIASLHKAARMPDQFKDVVMNRLKEMKVNTWMGIVLSGLAENIGMNF